ncbi:hypothetical protein [Microbacterium oxydans]|uniref:hypothetical protein n=1 Tax=Microbacterium oxydans TaxID=82380 RepID=UPI000F8FA23B|nr:hypothetical protein [Microbacterium oxydans]AZS46639.1 hypothetical protein CVS53_01313 [Microbacterium oxydans]
MSPAAVMAHTEPSDAAWRRSGDIAARILENLAQRDARAAAGAVDRIGDVLAVAS